MEEKRKFKRVSIDAIVMYIIENIDDLNSDNVLNIVGTPNSVDISLGGLRIIAGQKLPEGTLLKIVLSILSIKVSIEIIGEVKWTKKTGKGDLYQSGIEFIKYSDEKDREYIENYVKSQDN